jgi:hypothetical protein
MFEDLSSRTISHYQILEKPAKGDGPSLVLAEPGGVEIATDNARSLHPSRLVGHICLLPLSPSVW